MGKNVKSRHSRVAEHSHTGWMFPIILNLCQNLVQISLINPENFRSLNAIFVIPELFEVKNW